MSGACHAAPRTTFARTIRVGIGIATSLILLSSVEGFAQTETSTAAAAQAAEEARIAAEEAEKAAAAAEAEAAKAAADAEKAAADAAAEAAAAEATAAEAVTAAAADPDEKIEEINVTGTRIARSNLTDYGHVTVVDSEQIALSGVTTVDDLLRSLPSVTLQGINKNNNNGGLGVATLDLRNLNAVRTLVLVNGRRFVGQVVDLNDIPVDMIERVEVLLDGASAIYGSDAVAGVINFILKDDYEGFKASVTAGISDKADGEAIAASITTGASTGKGNVTINAQYTRRGKVTQQDREWAAEPSVFAFFNNGVDATNGIDDFYGSSFVPETRVGGQFFRPRADGSASFQAFDSPHLDKRYNYGEEQWLIGQIDRFALNMLAKYDISEGIQTYFEGTYTKRDSLNTLAPQPLGPGNSTFLNGAVMPITNQYIPGDYLATLPAGTQTININRRMVDVGNRMYNADSDSVRMLLGFTGEFLDRFRYDLFTSYARNRFRIEIDNSINYARAIETMDPELCAANAARGCVVGDYFGLGDLLANTPGAVDYIRYTDTEVQGDDLFNFGVNVGGELFDLPAGPFGAVVGFEFRDRDGFTFPSAINVAGDTAGNGQQPTDGGYNVAEAFGEINVPIVRDVPGLHSVDLDLAGRFSNYNQFGSNATYRLGLSWAPIQDIRLRGVLSSAFRAPSIGEAYGGSSDSFETLTDPCNDWETLDPGSEAFANCQSEGVPMGFNQNNVTGSQIRTNVGGNPDLEPETAQILNFGLVLTGKSLGDAMKGFSASVDYYNISVDNAITNPEAQVILNNCYDSVGLSHPDCANIGRGSNGAVNNLQAINQNIGKVATSGLDVTLGYALDLDRVGAKDAGIVSLAWQMNYLLDYTETQYEGTENESVSEFEGTLTSNKGTYSKLRWRLMGSYALGRYNLTSILRHVSGASIFGVEEGTDPYDSVSAVNYLDLVARYQGDSYSFILGVNNLLDQAPPIFVEGGQNASPASYDFMGTYFYTRFEYEF